MDLLQKAVLCCPALHTVRLIDGNEWGKLDIKVLGSKLQTVVLDCPVPVRSIMALLSQCSQLIVLECRSIYRDNFPWQKHWFEVQSQSLERIDFGGCSPLSQTRTLLIPEVCGTYQPTKLYLVSPTNWPAIPLAEGVAGSLGVTRSVDPVHAKSQFN